VRYTLTVSNQTASSVSGTTLRFRLPYQLATFGYLLGETCPSSYCESGELMTIVPGTLVPGDSRPFSINPFLRSDPDSDAPLPRASAWLFGASDRAVYDEVVSRATTVGDLRVALTPDTYTAAPGDEVVFTVDCSNQLGT